MGVTQTAEVAVLGSMLLEPERLAGEIIHRCEPEDFPTYRRLFLAARELFLQNRTIDPVVLASRAGAGYTEIIRDILMLTPTAVNWEEYVELLREQAELQRLQATATRILSCRTAAEARQALSEDELHARRRSGLRVVPFGEGLRALLDRLNDGVPAQYLKWGIRPLDERLSVEPGDFIILGADASVGKTALALQLAYTMAESGKRVGVFSLETSDRKAYDRMFARLARLPLSAIKAKRVDEDGMARLEALLDDADELPLEIVHSPGVTVAQLRAETLTRRYDVIFIDYVQIVRQEGQSRADVVAGISMALHTMAQELGVTVIALSQLTPPDPKQNRYRQNRKEDLRESRQLINDADVIMVMSRTDSSDENFRELVIDKNKDGPLGVVKLDFVPELMEFRPHKPTRSESYHAAMTACARASRRAFAALPDDGYGIPDEFKEDGK